MRVIAGKFRGVNLAGPKGDRTRPMLDRMKESLFSVLGGAFDGESVLDCFAGTGSLGIEALSRGAASCTFLETARTAREILRENIEKVGAQKESRILGEDVLRWEPDFRFQLLFYDPPYRQLQGSSALRGKTINRFAGLLLEFGGQGAQGIFHYPRNILDASELQKIPGLEIREYGTSAFAIGRVNP